MARAFVRIVLFLILLILLLAGFGVYQIRRPFPQTSGRLHLNGLQQAVEVYRDGYGVPHIYASNEHDLFMAQGFIHAQDRFWQMDFWRHMGAGRLSELFGKSQVKTDIALRTFGWPAVVAKEWESADARSRAILLAYAKGVNAFLRGRKGSDLSVEHALLRFTNRKYKIEPWQPVHSITWLKMMALDLCENMDYEISRAVLAQTLTTEQIAQLYPPYPSDHPVILDRRPEAAALHEFRKRASVPEEALTVLGRVKQKFEAVPNKLPRDMGVGSNSWVISGKLTSTHKPILANDPHLGTQMPSIWYQVHLNCDACEMHVAGFSFAGVPGVIIGHNDRIAWGFTNSAADVQDLYIEKINPANVNQYEVNGRWVDMRIVDETIKVANGSPVKIQVRHTRHGPVFSDTNDDLRSLQSSSIIQMPERFAVALRWTAFEPSFFLPALWKLNRARNWNEFREAAAEFYLPSQNMIYSDVDGNIGYQLPGRIPLRKQRDGRLPVPGWNDDHEWMGYIPFDSLPSAFNPSSGFVVTANNAVVDNRYENLIATDWDYGYRAARIVQMIREKQGPISITDVQRMQGDNKNLNAERLVPLLLQLRLSEGRLNRAQKVLSGWNYQNDMDAAAPAIFEAFWRHLLTVVFRDDLPSDYTPGGGSRWVATIHALINDLDSQWWDDRATPVRENRDQMMQRAFEGAVDELEKRLGSDTRHWRWGQLHSTTFRNSSFGRSGIRPLEMLFNRGPFPTSGGTFMVNATGWNSAKSYEVTSLPSMRMIVDMNDLSQSRAILTTGQSGHPSHRHYIDMADPWRKIQYHPMLWLKSQLEAQTSEKLSLLP